MREREGAFQSSPPSKKLVLTHLDITYKSYFVSYSRAIIAFSIFITINKLS